MALSPEYRAKSLNELIKRCKTKLNEKKKQLLEALNNLAAQENVPLGFQSSEVIALIDKTLDTPFDDSTLPEVANSIYSKIQEQSERDTYENQRRTRANGYFDSRRIHQRSLQDQLQDHDVMALMPISNGNIDVLPPANRHDQIALALTQDALDAALKNKEIKHIFIPVGPGHWRGIYLTKPDVDTQKYQLELFDPYGPGGATAIEDFALSLLKKCGINKDKITITTTGPTYPQRDIYACGDFTCAYSNKKMKQLGGSLGSYNEHYINVLDTQGNKKDILRHTSREITKILAESQRIVSPQERVMEEPEELGQLSFTESEKREFLIRLGKLFADPDKIDKAVFDREIAQIKSTFGTLKSASLRELDAYGVFNADGSINKVVASYFEIKFDEKQIKKRQEAYGLKHLSLREMLVFEAVISAVIKDLVSENEKKQQRLQDELYALIKSSSNAPSKKREIEAQLDYLKSHPPGRGLAKECFLEFGKASKDLKLKNPLSMELTGLAKQIIGMGYYKYQDINISISSGPYTARSLIPAQTPELYESQRDIARYLSNILSNNVSHVFAVGRVYPYSLPQKAGDSKEGKQDEIAAADFINYFIPDAHGRVMLPDIPELKGIHITSRPVQKTGRFITYEITINGSSPIQVHHLPIQDQLPLKLTPEELAHVKNTGMQTLPGQNIHAHCRDGKKYSTQLAYLLASENPKYRQQNHEQLIAQMSAENSSPVSLDEEKLDLYVLYGILLKQEIDNYFQQMGTSKKLVHAEHKELFELMEKHQELSSIPPHQLEEWVATVAQNPLVSAPTKSLLTSIKSSGDFLLHAFREQWDLDRLELFFDLAARKGEYQAIRAELAKASPRYVQQAQEIPTKQMRYESLFVARLQDAYLKNWQGLSKDDLIVCGEVKLNVSETLNGILDAFTHYDPKKFKKTTFDNLRIEYQHCKKRLALLDKIDNVDYGLPDAELRQRSELIEQFLTLGYDHFEVEPSRIILKMHWIYQRLGELSALNELSPQQWDELKRQFTALKIIFEYIQQDEAQPDVLLTLDKLFKEKREYTTNPFKLAISKVKPRKENLDDFVGSLGFAVLNAAFDNLPAEYYGDNGNGAYSREINQLLEAISALAKTYEKPKNGIVDLTQERKVPTTEEYEKAREQVLQLIPQHVPFFINTTKSLRVRIENLSKDFQRLQNHYQLRTPEFEELTTRLAELKSECNKQDDVLNNQLLDKVEQQIHKVDSNKPDSSVPQYSKSLENILRINAIKSGASQAILDEIDYYESGAERKEPKDTSSLPKRPKLIVFDIDEVLIDVEANKLQRARELVNVLKFAEQKQIEVVLTTSHGRSLDIEKQTSIAKLISIIASESGIDITHKINYLNTLPLRQEKERIASYLQDKISSLQKEVERLKEQANGDQKKLEIVKNLQAKIDSFVEKAIIVKLTSDKFLNLEVVRRSHPFKDMNNYYQAVEGGVLKDFKNPELTKNIGISDFQEKREIWLELFKLAKVLMESKALRNPKPSLQTILKDIVFDAHNPELLQKKYGDLHQYIEALRRIGELKKYFTENGAQIESFYQSRLAEHKLMYEQEAVLHEDEIVFFESSQDVFDQAHQHTNYRPIKLSDSSKNSLAYMVDLNYEMGLYNGVIAYLNEDKEHAPKAYGPKAINKTLESYLSSIPNFAKYEFQHSPIVLHVKISTLLGKLPELNAKEAVQQRYKAQFMEAASTRFNQLPKELQDDFVTTYYRNTREALEAINQKLASLISSPPGLVQFQDELTKLQEQLNKIIEQDEKFSQRISPTFLGSEAKLMGSMIEKILSGNIDVLQVDANHVRFKEEHEKIRTMVYAESMANNPHLYLKAIHPALSEMDLFDKNFITEQYTFYVTQQLEKIITRYINAGSQDQVVPSLSSITDFFKKILISLDPEQNKEIFKTYRLLPLGRSLCDDLAKVVPFQNMVNHLNGEPEDGSNEVIAELLNQIASHASKIESSEEFKAKLFWDKAEHYLRAKDWNVGFQWNTHTITFEGQEKKIPKTVAKQLEIIRQARLNNKYLDAKEIFLRVGREKELSWRSSSPARKYYSLFKEGPCDSESKQETRLESDLDKEFSKLSAIKKP